MQENKKTIPAWGIKVKTALLERGMSITDLAKALGYSRCFVSSVINGTDESDILKERIETFLDVAS